MWQLPESSRLESLKKVLVIDFTLQDEKDNTSGKLQREVVTDLPKDRFTN